MHTYRKEPAAPARILSPGLEEAAVRLRREGEGEERGRPCHRARLEPTYTFTAENAGGKWIRAEKTP